jgi:predicted histone-like DNA-binding protein
MSIKYTATRRKNMIDPAQKPKSYATAVSRGKLKLTQIAVEIASRTSLSTTDTVAVLDALTHVLPTFLEEGYIISLGDFGSFTVNLKSNGVEKEKDLSPKEITGFHLTFRPGKELRSLLTGLKAEKAKKKIKNS